MHCAGQDLRVRNETSKKRGIKMERDPLVLCPNGDEGEKKENGVLQLPQPSAFNLYLEFLFCQDTNFLNKTYQNKNTNCPICALPSTITENLWIIDDNIEFDMNSETRLRK